MVRTSVPQRKGVMPLPTTGSWLIAMISSFLRIAKASLLIEESCEDLILSPGGLPCQTFRTHICYEKERRLHQSPRRELRLLFFER